MKVSLIIPLVTSLVTIASSERLNCKVVPFETKEGLTGTCCVFFKNNTNSNNVTLPKEEISKQAIDNRYNNNEDKPKPSQDKPKNEDDKLVFIDRERGHNNNNISNNTNNNKRKPVKESEVNNQQNVTIQNKNAFDTPEVCPQGTMRDHNGNCQVPFD